MMTDRCPLFKFRIQSVVFDLGRKSEATTEHGQMSNKLLRERSVGQTSLGFAYKNNSVQ